MPTYQFLFTFSKVVRRAGLEPAFNQSLSLAYLISDSLLTFDADIDASTIPPSPNNKDSTTCRVFAFIVNNGKVKMVKRSHIFCDSIEPMF